MVPDRRARRRAGVCGIRGSVHRSVASVCVRAHVRTRGRARGVSGGELLRLCAGSERRSGACGRRGRREREGREEEKEKDRKKKKMEKGKRKEKERKRKRERAIVLRRRLRPQSATRSGRVRARNEGHREMGQGLKIGWRDRERIPGIRIQGRRFLSSTMKDFENYI